MYADNFKAAMLDMDKESVPTETLQICMRKSTRGSAGVSSEPSKEFLSSLTCVKVVIEWSTGMAPGRFGKARQEIPGHI